MYQQIVFAAATAILAPAAFAALEHPARQQVQQNIDTVLKIIKNQSLSEQQKIRQVEQYANRFLDYERLSPVACRPWRSDNLGDNSARSRSSPSSPPSKKWLSACMPVPL